nr:immunoglobulin heavy chain junction region [Mus musculus]
YFCARRGAYYYGSSWYFD